MSFHLFLAWIEQMIEKMNETLNEWGLEEKNELLINSWHEFKTVDK